VAASLMARRVATFLRSRSPSTMDLAYLDFWGYPIFCVAQ
jgi:hypothetical protein